MVTSRPTESQRQGEWYKYLRINKIRRYYLRGMLRSAIHMNEAHGYTQSLIKMELDYLD